MGRIEKRFEDWVLDVIKDNLQVQVWGGGAAQSPNFFPIKNVAALRQAAPITDAIIWLRGYYTDGDGGEGAIFWNATDTRTENLGTIFTTTANAGGTGRWNRLVAAGAAYNVKWFGSKVDASTDDVVTNQACHDAAYTANVGMFFPAGTCLTSKIIYKGVPISGDGAQRSIIQGKPKQDIFYAPDPTTSEVGSLATFPEHMTIRDVTINLDNSQALTLPGDFNRPVFPLVGTWAATTAYSTGQWIKTSTGTIYICIAGGTTASSEPNITFGRLIDGTVTWEYVWSAQVYVGNAIFAFPASDGSVAGVNNVLHAEFKNVRLGVTGSASTNSATSIYAQRGIYDVHFDNFISRFQKYGVMVLPPTSNFASVTFAPDACEFSDAAFYNDFPLIVFNATHWTCTDFQVYASNAGQLGPWILQYLASGRQQTDAINFVDLLIEPNSSTTGSLAIFQGQAHTINGGSLKQAAGAAYIYWSADASTINESNIGNDGANPALRITGNRNKFSLNISTAYADSSFIDDEGEGNEVFIDSTSSHNFDAARRMSINKSRPPAWVRSGEFAVSGLARTTFLNVPDLFLVPGDILWQQSVQPAITKSATVESGEYATIAAPGGAFFSVAHRQTLTVGTDVPNCKIRVWISAAAASGTPTQSVSLKTGAGTSRGSMTMNLTTSFQIFSFDADVDLAAVGDKVQPTFNNTSTNVGVNIAWIAFQPIPVDLVSRVSADNGDNAKTLTVGVSEMTQIWNTALTLNRAVTLSTTNAYNGSRFHIVRKAGATGGSTLDVGTGPLKSLAVSQWVDVEFDGTAWFESRFGSL